MEPFQRNINYFRGTRRTSHIARDLDVHEKTVRSWLDGKSIPGGPTLTRLVEFSGIPSTVWLGGDIREFLKTDKVLGRFSRLFLQGIPVAGAEMPENVQIGKHDDHGSDIGELMEIDAVEPRILWMSGDSACPVASDGHAVVFDAGRGGEVSDGEMVVVLVGAELKFRRRATVGETLIYSSINPSGYLPPIMIPASETPSEFPVVAVVFRCRRRVGE